MEQLAAKRQLREVEKDCERAERRLSLYEKTDSVEPQRYKARHSRKRSATALLCYTDWHWGETINPETVNGLNEFNPRVRTRRLETLLSRSINLIEWSRAASNIKEVAVWLGGDLITGQIHLDQLEDNSESAPLEVLGAQDAICGILEGILNLSGISRIRVICNFGNHGRTTIKMQAATAWKHSYEWMMYQNCARYFRRAPVDFQIAKSYHALATIEGYPFRFHHGDAIRSGGGVGGLAIPANRLISKWNINRGWVYRDVFGHWHQWEPSSQFLAVGCLCGHTAYVDKKPIPYQPPTQAYAVVDKEYGLVDAKPIFLEKAKESCDAANH